MNYSKTHSKFLFLFILFITIYCIVFSGGIIVYAANPTDIILSNNSINENLDIATIVADLSVILEEDTKTYTFSLIDGEGSEDNLSFIIEGDQLKTNEVFNYEDKNQYNIRIKVDDGSEGYFEKSFVIYIENVNEGISIIEENLVEVIMDEDSSPTEFSLTLNAIDEDGDTIIWSIETQATSGTALVSDTNTGTSQVIFYQPNDNYNGDDSFVVKVSDENGETDTILVNVNISPINDLPENTSLPSISGELFENEIISANVGEWNDDKDGNLVELSYSYQWQRADDFEGSELIDIEGATESTYILTNEDNKKYIRLKVTCKDSGIPETLSKTEYSEWYIVGNHAPTISEGDFVDVSMDEDGSPTDFSLTLNATDIDLDTIIWSIEKQASDGTASVSGTSTSQAILYNPNNNYYGNDSFVVKVEDVYGFSDTITVNVNINPIDDAPSISDGSTKNIEFDEDELIYEFTLKVDEVEGDNITWTISSGAALGVASIEGTGTGLSEIIRYSVDENINGSDDFIVSIYDDNGKEDTITVNVTINPVNDPPVNTIAPSFIGKMHNGETLTALSGEWNDSLDGNNPETISYTYMWQSADDISGSGLIDIDNADESSYTITENENNKYIRLKVIASDGGTPGSETTIAYSEYRLVTNDSPVILGDEIRTVTMSEDSNPVVFSLTLEVSDEDGDTIDWSIKTQAISGTATVSGSGTSQAINYIPDEDYNGKDSFEVEIIDGNGGTDTVEVNVTIDAINDKPENTSLPQISGIKHNGEILSASTGDWNDNKDNNSGLLSYSYQWQKADDDKGNGLVNIEGATKSTYQLTQNENDKYVRVEITCEDDGIPGITSEKAYSQWYLVENVAPIISEGNSKEIEVLEDMLDYTFDLNATDDDGDIISWIIETQATSGTATIIGDDTGTSKIISYVPNEDYFGKDSFEIKAKDDNNGESIITINVDVIPVNDLPSFAKGEDQTVFEDAEPQIINSWATSISKGSNNEDNQILTFILTTNNDELFTEDGRPSIDPSTGDLTYTLAENANGSATVSAILSDDGGTFNSGIDTTEPQLFMINVTPVNDAPTMTNIEDFEMDEDTTTSPAFIINDIDNNVNDLAISYETSDTALLPKSNISINRSDNDININIEPVADRTGIVDVSITISDVAGLKTSQTFKITVKGVNDAPTIGDISDRTIDEDGNTGNIGISVNDIDSDVNSITLSAISSNTELIDEECIVFGGSGANRTIIITPKDDINGSAEITVTISDGSLYTDTSFTVNVQPVNDAPVILDLENISTNEDTSTGAISFRVSDIDDDEESLEIKVSASNTSMIPRANIELGGSGENRTLNLIPETNKFGTSEITVTVKDESGALTSDTFILTVEAVNDDPTISSINNQSTNEDQTKSISFTIGDIEDDYVDLTLVGSSDSPEIVENSGITFGGTGSTRTVNITPVTNKSGEAVITLTITDQGGLTSQSIFTLTVNSVNDSPSFTKGENQIREEDCGYQHIESWATNMSAGPSDEYGQELSFIVTNDNNSLFEVQPSISTIGALSYTPATDANGIANVSVKLSDGGDVNSLSATQTFTIEITEVNDKPVAKEMIITLNTDEDKSYKGNLRASDIENDSLTYEIVSNGSKGFVEITNGSTGAFTYTPGVNQYGEDSFTFKVNDGEFDSDVANITAIIQGVNDPPVANGGSITTDEDNYITATLSASDIDNETLVYSIIQQPEKGNISLDTNTGQYTYTPYSDIYGSDNFTFKVSDGELNSNTASMLITINPVNDKPLATGETIELNEDQQLNGILKANDIEHDSLTYIITNNPINGTLVLNNTSTGIYTYTPNNHFSGSDTFKFKVNDGSVDSDIATVVINVFGVNHVPTINDPIVVNINEDESYIGNFVASDPDGDLVTYSIVSPTMYGTINIDNTTNGAFTYTPKSDFNGKDIATYKVYDGEYYSDIVTATFNVSPVNDIPEAYSQYIDTDLNTPIDVNLIAYDIDGDNLTYTIENWPSNGTLTQSSIDKDYAYVYTPKTDYVGQDMFRFKVNDGESDSNIATVVIHVNGGGGSGAYGITVLDKITMDQDTTTTAAFSIDGYDNVSVTAISSNYRLIDSSGINITNKSGNDYEIELTPNQAKYGFSIIRVEASGDGDGQSDIDTFILEVNRVEHPPVANDKEINMDENTILNEFVTGSDYNGDSLVFGKTSDPMHGSLSFYTDRIFIYTPNENYFGTDSFRFKAIDSRNYESEDATVTINIRKVSMAPIATNSAIETNEDTTYSGNLVGYDIHGEEINFEIVNTGVHGEAKVTNAVNGAFSYTPNENYNGSDYFTFKIRNENGLWSSIARVDVIINPINDVPVAIAPILNTDEDQLITGFLKGTDVENSPLTYEIVSEPNKGTISLTEETGAFTYNPCLNENGSDEFTFKAKESDDVYSTATAIITINPVNDAPEAEETIITIYEDTTTSGALNFLVSDVDNGDIQTFELIKNGNKGTASITTSGDFTYIPKGDVNGIDYFTFKTRDSGGLYSNVDRVTVNIIPVNDEPSITDPSTWTINEDSINNKYYFTVGDIEDLDGTLIVGGISNNTNLIPNENISFDGTDGDRWINVTPIDSVTGTAIITITTTDSGIDSNITGEHLSASTTLTITVVDVDDTPTINGQSTNNKAITSTITIDEDTSTGAISFTIDDEESGGNLTVTGSSNNSTLVKTDGILFDGEGNNRTINIIPEPNKYGNARITVSASDGNTSRTAYIDLIVKPVNDAPIVNPPANQTINEDSSTEILYFTISDIDSDVEDINITALSQDESIVLSTNITVSGNGEERTVKVTPTKDANGEVNIKLIANDGESVNPTESGIFTVHVNPVNDKPSIESISNQVIDEDTLTSQIAITIDDIDTLSENLILSSISGNTSLINTDGITFGGSEGNRWIVLKPKDDQYGSGLITVIVSDGEKTSSTSFNLIVNPVNDAPIISNISDQQIYEDESTNIITFTVGDIDNDVTELSIVKISADEEVIPTDNIITVGNGAERTVKITPAANENGSIDIELIVKDADNLTSSSIFTVDIVPINDIPSFKVGSNQISNEDDGQQTITGWAIGIDKGFINEDGQELTFVTSTNNDDLFSQLPSVDEITGNLTYTAAENINGVATVTIYLKDDGGTTNGGIDTTSLQTFTITVDSVNDVPSFTKGEDQIVDEDSVTQNINGWATNILKGPEDESNQTLSFIVTTDNDSLFATGGKPEIDANGNLTYTSAVDANGKATVTVKLHDNGGIDRDGVDTSEEQTFLIKINSINDAPIFNLAGDQIVYEDSGTNTVNVFLSDKDEGGEIDENTQTLDIDITTNNDSLFVTDGKPTIDLTSGDLTYTLADDANGVAIVTVILSDNGGTTSGGIDATTKEFTITVLPVNDVPLFKKGSDQTVLEDSGVQTVSNWATAISKGPSNENNQTLTFIVTADDESLFVAGPAIDGNGNLTYTPADDANGSTLVTVTLKDDGGTDRDGVDTTLSQSFMINITAVNDVPSFIAKNQIVNEDSGLQMVTGWAEPYSEGAFNETNQALTFDLTINDESLFSQQPAVDENGTLTYIPAANVYGSTTITAILFDDGGTTDGGMNTTEPQTFTITVNSVNDAPSFKAGSNQMINEDVGLQTVSNWATDISKGPDNESGQELTFNVKTNNDGLFATGGKPSIDTNGNLTYTPASDANGEAMITVTLSDDGGTTNSGIDTTSSQAFTITVNSVNDVPSFIKGSDQVVNEDVGLQTVSNWATDISKGPDNESSQALKFNLTTNNDGLFAIDGNPTIDENGNLTYTPENDVYGEAIITVTLSDDGGTTNSGIDTTSAQAFTITVNSVNDVPSFIAGSNQTVNEDAGAQIVSSWATDISKGPDNESGQELTFKVKTNNDGLFATDGNPTIDENGNLTYTPENDVHGEAIVIVTLSDDGGTTNSGIDTTSSQSFTIKVNSVNDVPSFTKGSNQVVNEDAGTQTVCNWATDISKGPDNESGQELTFNVITKNDGLFSTGGKPSIDEKGNLTYTPANDANGEAMITVTLLDDGGTTNSGIDTTSSQAFTITVNSVNDTPSFIKGSDQVVNEDAGLQTVSNWATDISKGPDNESGQELTFKITSNNEGLFATDGKPSIDTDGNLTYTPENDVYGTAVVTVTLSDDGGTTNSGIDTTSSQAFTITVNSVNDEPSFTKGSDQVVNEDAGKQTISNWATDISKGPSDEDNQILTFNVTTNNDGLFVTGGKPSIDENGDLTYTPEDDIYGEAMITVTLSDDGGIENEGDNDSTQIFTITINSVNDVPSFNKGSDQVVDEDAGAQTINGWATNISKGPNNEKGQSLTFNIETDNDSLFAKVPSIDSAGNLTYTPADNVNGEATVTVTLSDDGGKTNGGIDTTTPQTFTIKVNSVVDRIMVLEGEILNAVTKEKIINAEVNLLDLSGKILTSTISSENGTYEFRDLSEGRYVVEVNHPEYSHNSRMTEVSFDKNKLGIITENFLMADFTLELVANPTAILGDGKDISVLTAIVKDRNGLPIPNIDLDFYAESGKLLGESVINTDDNGEATIQYQSAKLSGTDALVIPVMVSVNNPEKDLYGTNQMFVTFAPGFIEGIVTDGTTSGSAIEGAVVTVYKDFDGDGITDFSFTQITGEDGRYRIAIPKGNIEYEISITKPVLVGDRVEDVIFKQKALAGDISGIGNEQYKSEKVATGVIIVKNSDGSSEIMDKEKLCSELKMEIVYPDDSVQAIVEDNIDGSTGVFSSESLNPGNYEIVVKHDLGDGNEIIVGRTEVSITEDGEVSINEILIDPYGTVTRKGTNIVIPGVEVKLYYANTDRNTKTGKIPDTMVELPEILGFKPANNANPQQTDDNGNYAFMVFPNTDYYIIANKSGYRTHKSETISVNDEIVLYNFEMSRIKHNTDIIASTEEKDLAISIKSAKMKIEEEKEFKLIVDYINKSDIEIEDVILKVTIPEEIEVINANDGAISDKTINYHFDSLASGEVGKIEINVKSLNQDKAEKYIEISTNITSSNELISLQDDYSMIRVLIYSNKFTMTHKRYIKGYPDGTFRPSNSITRAEVATIFARLLDLDVSNKKTTYNDINSEHWALGYINSVSDANLMNGYQDGTFAADKPITRAEFATIIARYFGLERDNNIKPIKLHFNDITNNWAMSNIEEIYRFGIVNGYNDGTFKPQSAILRTEAATMINRMLYRGPVKSDISQFNDVGRNDWYFGNVEESAKTHEYIINEDGSETIIRWIDDSIK